MRMEARGRRVAYTVFGRFTDNSLPVSDARSAPDRLQSAKSRTLTCKQPYGPSFPDLGIIDFFILGLTLYPHRYSMPLEFIILIGVYVVYGYDFGKEY